MSSTETKVARKGLQARQNALKKFIEAHQEEFDAILSEERKALGLLPKIKRQTMAQLHEELAAARAEIEHLRGHNQ
jgi:vacuolar-type H+-ATPase subunit E/Vma4